MPGILLVETDPLDILEAQIIELEKRIIGEAQLGDRETPIPESLVHSNNQVHQAVSSYESIKSMFDRINQLGTFLNPSYEELLVSRSSKVRTVLETEGELCKLLEQLNKLNNLSDNLTTEPLKNISNLYNKLRGVTESIINLEEDYKQVDIKAKNLLESFATSMRILNQSLALFDSFLTEIEQRDYEIKSDD